MGILNIEIKAKCKDPQIIRKRVELINHFPTSMLMQAKKNEVNFCFILIKIDRKFGKINVF